MYAELGAETTQFQLVEKIIMNIRASLFKAQADVWR